MLARLITDQVTLVSGSSFSSPVTYRLKQQRRRLEAIFVEVDMPDSVTISAPTSESFGNAIKQIQVSVNDVAGARNVVDIAGPAALDYWTAWGGSLPAPTAAAYGNQLTTAQTNRRVTYPVFFRHPQLEEPSGNLTSIPLYELNDDPVITLTPGTATECGTGFAFGTNTRVRLILCYRDIAAGDYIPGALVSSNFDSVSSSSKYELEVPSNGLLTSLLLQGYTTSAKVTRRNLCSAADHAVQFMYGREQIRNTSQHFIQDWQGWTSPELGYVPASGVAPGLAGIGSKAFFDFLDDSPLIGAFRAASAINLTSIKAGGDSAKVVIDQTNASALYVRMTTHKWLGGPVGQLQMA